MITIIQKVRGGGAIPARPSFLQTILGLVGGTLGIGGVAIMAQISNLPLLIAPLGATCVLLFALPDAPLAQPRNVIGGHFVSSLVGLLFLKYAGTGLWQIGLAVGCSIALMQLTRTLHPPAGADPLVVMLGGTVSWGFLLTPVLVSSTLLVCIALVVNNIGEDRKWPKYWC